MAILKLLASRRPCIAQQQKPVHLDAALALLRRNTQNGYHTYHDYLNQGCCFLTCQRMVVF